MPLYTFEIDGKVSELIFSYKDVPKVGESIVLSNGKKAKRLPNSFCVSTPTNPFRIRELASKERKGETVGETIDRSRDASEQRAKLHGGVDPVRQKFFNDYSLKRRGALHPDDPRKHS